MRPHTLLVAAVNGAGTLADEDGNMPWHCPEEWQWFKYVTNYCILVVGNKTWERIKHNNWVGQKTRSFRILSTVTTGGNKRKRYYRNLRKAIIGPRKRQVVIIGGANVYEQAMSQGLVDIIYLSRIHENNVEGPVKFPPIPAEYVLIKTLNCGSYTLEEYVKEGLLEEGPHEI